MNVCEPLIGVVTVLYNSESVLEDFFRTLEEQTYRNFALYIVDNKSLDASFSLAHELSEGVSFRCVFLPQESNTGVAAGNNVGIKSALSDGCEYVLLSNNDVVLERDCIEKLYQGMREMNATMAVPKIYYWNTDKVIWCVGGMFSKKSFSTVQNGQKEKDTGQYDKNTLTDYSPTCFMLIRRDVFDRVGMMDEAFFVYYDDSDFVWRAVRDRGEKHAYICNSVLWHKESISTGGGKSPFSIRYLHRNHIYFALKHYEGFDRVRLFAYLIAHYVFRDSLRYNCKELELILRSYREGLLLYRKMKTERCL